MPHISLPEGLPGITAGFAFRPETAKPMRELAHILLHEPNSLTPGERELIATYVSSQNDCYFCQTSHGAAAACHLGSSDLVKQVKTDFETAPVSPKLKALLAIAGKVQQGGKNVTADDVDARPSARRNRPRDPRHRADRRRVLACTTATWTDSAPGSRTTKQCTRRWANTSRPRVIASALRSSRSPLTTPLPEPALSWRLRPRQSDENVTTAASEFRSARH